MSYTTSAYSGDHDYVLNCTGDAVVGDEVRFERATFTGSFRNARFAGFERITAKIAKDSYGAKSQQHTFTLVLTDGEILRIKGRNLYASGLYRKIWPDESARTLVAREKHARGDRAARAMEAFAW